MYRKEIVDKPNGGRPLLVNDGKPFRARLTPVLDGDRKNDSTGDGWVQVGEPTVRGLAEPPRGAPRRLPMGGRSVPYKGPHVWAKFSKPWDALVLSSSDACAKLTDALIIASPSMLSAALAAAATPKSVHVALRLLEEHSKLAVDEVLAEPLLADDSKRLRQLVKAISGWPLVEALCASATIKQR